MGEVSDMRSLHNSLFFAVHPYQQEEFLNHHIIYCPQCQSNNQHTTEVLRIPREGYHHASPILKHTCVVCGIESYDYYDKPSTSEKYNLYRIFPQGAPVNLPAPNTDLPKTICDIYLEASYIFEQSPRASAALLRLCLQQLLQYLGFHGAINEMIKQAVQKGVPEHIQQFMDITRHHGNAAAHGGDLALNPDENRDNTEYLFTVINTLAECLITRPREAKEAYNKLPESIRQQIARRDK